MRSTGTSLATITGSELRLCLMADICIPGPLSLPAAGGQVPGGSVGDGSVQLSSAGVERPMIRSLSLRL